MAKFTEEQKIAFKDALAGILVEKYGYTKDAAHTRIYNGEVDVLIERTPAAILNLPQIKTEPAATIAQFDRNKKA